MGWIHRLLGRKESVPPPAPVPFIAEATSQEAAPRTRKSVKKWRIDPAQFAWLDQPDALELLESRRRKEKLGEEYYRLLLSLAKRGESLLWQGMMLHGGSEIKNPKQTRKSYVIYYIPAGMNVGNEVVGPFNR